MRTLLESKSKAYVLTLCLVFSLGIFDDPVASAGNEQTGMIEGSVGDQQGSWITFRNEDLEGSPSTSEFSSPAGFITAFTLQGHEEAAFKIQNSVSVDFTMMNDQLVEAGVTYFPEPSMTPFYGAHENSVSIELTKIEVDGDTAVIEGRAVGKIFKVTGFTTPPDTNDAMDVDLRFKATAYKQE